MAKVSASASLSVRYGLAGKKGFGSHDGATPFHSLSVETEVPDTLTPDELIEEATKLDKLCEKRVKDLMNKELKELRDMP